MMWCQINTNTNKSSDEWKLNVHFLYTQNAMKWVIHPRCMTKEHFYTFFDCRGSLHSRASNTSSEAEGEAHQYYSGPVLCLVSWRQHVSMFQATHVGKTSKTFKVIANLFFLLTCKLSWVVCICSFLRSFSFFF